VTNTSVLVQQFDLAGAPCREAAVWRADVSNQLGAGARLITLFGRRGADGVVLISAVLQPSSGPLALLRTALRPDAPYHELTSEWAALHCFERELHEQTGLLMAGHPWLKPLRYEGCPASDMDAYPFYKIDGKEVHEVAVGPIHAGVIEPGSFRFMCLGEQVEHLEIQLGYQHRGVERQLLGRDPRTLGPLVESIAGDSSITHAWAYAAALESLAGVGMSLEVEVARAVALELERVAMHLSALAGMAADIAFLQGATTYARLRTIAINTSMRLCGSRFGRGALRPGGVSLRGSSEVVREVRANVGVLATDIAIINACFLDARSVQHRLRALGVLSEESVRALGIVGLAARASGVGLDARQKMPQGAYAVLPISPHVLAEGDCLSRARLRMLEIGACLDWLSRILELYPGWQEPRHELGALQPSQLAVSVVEGFRGEVVHCLETDAAGGLLHYKVQDPSLRNWMGLALAVRNHEISEFPICNKSFDLSYCGHDL
jgi:Ni,Fe-hydrogenase III large subunit